MMVGATVPVRRGGVFRTWRVIAVVALLVSCRSVTSRPIEAGEDIPDSRLWQRTVYYALPWTDITIELSEVKLTMRPGRYCAWANDYRGVVDTPRRDGEFCERDAERPFVEFRLVEPRIRTHVGMDERYRYRVDRLRLPDGSGVEHALDQYGLLTGSRLLPPRVVVEPTTVDSAPVASSYAGDGDALKPDTPGGAALLIHRLQEARLALVSSFQEAQPPPDRETLELMLEETDRAIADLNALFVKIERDARSERHRLRLLNRSFCEPAADGGCVPATGTAEVAVEVARFSWKEGLAARDGAEDVERVIARVRLVDPSPVTSGGGDASIAPDADPVRTDGIVYREGREIEIVIEVGQRELTRRRIHVAQLGPIRALSPRQLAEIAKLDGSDDRISAQNGPGR